MRRGGGGRTRGEYRKLFWPSEGSSNDDWERMWLKKTNKQVKGRECEWLEWVRVKGVHVSGWVGLNDFFNPTWSYWIEKFLMHPFVVTKQNTKKKKKKIVHKFHCISRINYFIMIIYLINKLSVKLYIICINNVSSILELFTE